MHHMQLVDKLHHNINACPDHDQQPHLLSTYHHYVQPAGSFMSELTAAIYGDHTPDRVLVEAALQKQGKTLADFSTSWRNQRIRRTILGGSETQAAVLKVLQKFKGKVCTATGAAVVTDEVMLVYSNQAKADIAAKGKLCNTFDMMKGETMRLN